MQERVRIVFFPVSSARGMGEYVRSLCLAKAIHQLHPDWELAFGLNRGVSYIADCPFTVLPLSDTPTRCTSEVISAIDQFKPDVAIFDASGRVRQLAYCKQKKIKTIFIAQHNNKLNKALRLRRLCYTDLILVAQPLAFAKAPGVLQQLWMKFLKKNAPLYVGPIFPQVNQEKISAYLHSMVLTNSRYVLVNAGGGGNTLALKGGNRFVSDIFLEAAVNLATTTTQNFVVIMGRNYRGLIPERKVLPENVCVISHCDEEEFNILLTHACAGILSGGSSLLQASACGLRNILAVPIASDQQERIQLCVKFYGIQACKLTVQDITREFTNLLQQDEKMEVEKTPAITNGLDTAVAAMLQLMEKSAIHEKSRCDSAN